MNLGFIIEISGLFLNVVLGLLFMYKYNLVENSLNRVCENVIIFYV